MRVSRSEEGATLSYSLLRRDGFGLLRAAERSDGWRRTRHDSGSRAGPNCFINVALNNFHALKVFLHDLFPGYLQFLHRVLARSLTGSINGVLLDQDSDLLCQIGASCELGDALAGDTALGEVTLPLADQKLLRGKRRQACARRSAGGCL